MSGRSQHVTIPAEYRFKTKEVTIRRDEQSGDVILSPVADRWEAIFAALDEEPFPDDFLDDRNQGVVDVREVL